MRFYEMMIQKDGQSWVGKIDELPSDVLNLVLRERPTVWHSEAPITLESIREQILIELYIREHNLRG